MNRPRLFLSAVSDELRSARKAVAATVRTLGYDPVSQEDFPTGHGDLRQWLREQIHGCEGLIQLVGDAYGAEPPEVDPKYGRVSYTQFEFLYARRREKKTWIIVIGEQCRRDKPLDSLDLPGKAARPDATGYQVERRILQQTYLARLRQENHLLHIANNDTELESIVLRLRDALGELRRQWQEWLRQDADFKARTTDRLDELAEAARLTTEKIRADLPQSGAPRESKGHTDRANRQLSPHMNERLREEVLNYLERLAQRFAALPGYFPRHLRSDVSFDKLHQRVAVIEDPARYEKARIAQNHRKACRVEKKLWDVAETYKRLKQARPDFKWSVDSGDFIEDEKNTSRGEKSDGRLPPLVDSPPPVTWDEDARHRFRRTVILADAGHGKTWLLRHEARRIASEGAEKLRSGTITLEELEFPILADLTLLTECDGAVRDVLISHVVDQGGSEYFKQFVRAKLDSTQYVVLLDALDEARLVEQAPRTLRRRIEDFDHDCPNPRLLLTSRKAGFAYSPLPSAHELQLLPFDKPHTEAFVRLYFTAEPQKASRLLSEITNNPDIQDLTRIPLMLSLVCRAFTGDKLTCPLRRVELYRYALCDLLEHWQKEVKDREDVNVGAVLETLESIAYQLFPRYRFPLDEVLDVLQQGKDCEHVDQLLERDGILIKGTVPGSDLHFLHQTFHEYLVARALANKVRKEGWKNVARLIKRKAWHIEWRPVIVLLAGQLPDPSLLLELLADEKRDELFCHRLSLAAECLLELSPTFRQSHSHVIDAITTTALFQWMKFHAGLTVQELDNHDDYELDLCVDLVPQVNHALAAVGAARGRVDSQLLKRRVPHWMSGYSMLWRRLRKWLPEIEQEGKGMEVTQVLLACLHRSHIPWWLRFLRRIAEDTPDGQRIFDAWWRRPAIRALGIVGTAMARNSPDIAAALLKFLLSSEYYFVDRALGDAFRTMGGSLSTRDLIEAVFLHPDAERIVGRLLFGRWRRSRLSQGASLYTDLLDALGAVAARGEAGGGGGQFVFVSTSRRT